MSAKPFEGLLVVELASVLAGPAVGQFFSELGARVVKIENAITGGDVTRSWKVKGEDSDKPDSAYFRSVNYGKEFKLLNLTEAVAQHQVHELISQADVVISNFNEAAGKKMAMDAVTLRSLNPQLIFAHLSAFGPGNDRPAYDIVLQAETGFLSMSGTKAGELCRMPVALIDLLAAHQLKEGILVALIRKMKTGKGSIVRVNLYASALASLANQATNYLIAGAVAKPLGTEHPNIAPYGDIFTLADGERIVLAVGTDRQFAYLCDILTIFLPPHLTTNEGRVANRNDVVSLLTAPLSHCSLEELLLLCKSKRIPIGHVKNMRQVFAESLAQSSLLTYADGQRAVKTVVFEVED
jgi:crotonobetainyl-CoA:carnitine CoA-transferase CaiB-like acyl-CoA transferase